MENLYETIFKMDKSERLFFRRGYKKKELPHYIVIYDLIIKSRTTNTELLNKKIKALNLGNENYLKHQLLENLLTSITQCNVHNNEQVFILNEIATINTLRFKKQIKLAQKKWQQLFIYCKKLEFPTYIEILVQEKLKLDIYTNQNFNIYEHRKLLDFSTQHAKHYIQLLHLRIIYQDLLFIRKSSAILTNENKELFKTTINHFNLLKEKSAPNNAEYFFIYKMSEALIYFLNEDFNNSILILSNCLDKITKPLCYLKYNNEFLLDFIKLYADIVFIIEKFDLVVILISKINKIKISASFYQTQFDVLIFLIKNNYFSASMKYKELGFLFAQNKANFIVWIESSTKEMKTVLYSSIAVSYFIVEHYQDALFYARNVIASYNQSFRQELITFFYLFEILITFELNDTILFESKVQTANAHFKKNKEQKELGLEIICRLHKAFNATTISDKINNLQILSAFLESKKLSTQIFFTYFNIPLWINAKMHNMKYREYKKINSFGILN